MKQTSSRYFIQFQDLSGGWHDVNLAGLTDEYFIYDYVFREKCLKDLDFARKALKLFREDPEFFGVPLHIMKRTITHSISETYIEC